MRVPKNELSELLGASAIADTPSAQVIPQAASPDITHATPGLSLAPSARNSVPTRQAQSDVRFELARALPNLWAKAQKDAAAGKALRDKDKLRELLVWLLTKRQATVRQRVTLHFLQAGRQVLGRLDLVAHLADRSELAIEVDWAYARPSIEKLLAAHHQGMHVMWVCGAPLTKAAAKALRTRANVEFGPTYGWLFMYHLEHGWL